MQMLHVNAILLFMLKRFDALGFLKKITKNNQWLKMHFVCCWQFAFLFCLYSKANDFLFRLAGKIYVTCRNAYLCCALANENIFTFFLALVDSKQQTFHASFFKNKEQRQCQAMSHK